MLDNKKLFSKDNISDEEKFSDKKMENKIHHHLTDANDLISDDDIKDIRTDVGIQSEPSQSFSEEELQKAEKEETEKQKDDEEENPTISSWNILDS